MRRGGRDRLLLRSGVPPGNAARRGAAPRDGHRHRLQLPGPAHQSRPAEGGRDRLCRPPDGPGHGPGAGGSWWACPGLPWRRRPRRTDHCDHVVGVGGRQRGGRGRPDRPVGPRHPGRGCRGAPGRAPGVQRRRLPPGARRRARTGARRGPAQCRGGAGRLRRAGRPPARRARPGPRAGRRRRRRGPGGRPADPLDRKSARRRELAASSSRRCRSRSRTPLPGRGGSTRGKRCGSRCRRRPGPC